MFLTHSDFKNLCVSECSKKLFKYCLDIIATFVVKKNKHVFIMLGFIKLRTICVQQCYTIANQNI